MLAHPREAEHRHRLVGLDLAQALHHAADAPVAGVLVREHGEAHVPRRIDPEIARDDDAVVEHPAHREALRHEPPVQARGDLIVARMVLDADQGRGDPHPRRLREPPTGEHVETGTSEGPVRHPVAHQGVGDELGMALPLELVLAEIAEPVRRPGRRMRRAVPVQERVQMRDVGGAVALGGVLGPLDR